MNILKSIHTPVTEQRGLLQSLAIMSQFNQQDNQQRYCIRCSEEIGSKKDTDMCVDCLNISKDDTHLIQYPDLRFYDPNGHETLEYYHDCIEHDLPDLGNLTIDDILTQDDPPKELYLNTDDTNEQNQTESEITDDIDESTVHMIYYGDEVDEENEILEQFSIYDHFGIPNDISDMEADAWLEAAIPDRDR